MSNLARRCAGVVAVALPGLVAAGSVSAYRFWSENFGDDGFPIAPVADEAIRWDSDAWGPGETLHWEVSPDEDWAVLFESEDGVLPWVERAMDSWSGISTADISWTLDGVGEAEPRVTEDSVNSLFIDADSGAGGYAGIWRKREQDDGPWRMFGCDIALGWSFAVKPDSFDDWDADEQSDWLDGQRNAALYVLVHEFGHCVGLAHSAMLSTALRDLGGASRETHAGDPAMSYGRELPHPDDLSRDDIVGASLLRPASGYRRRSGNIAGTVTMPGLPVDFAAVWALPLGEHPLRDRVGVFTNHTGYFELEGLDPGDYLIIAQPIIDFLRPHEFLGPVRVSDVIRGRLVRVSAGRTARGADVSMRWGREVRAPYAEAGVGRGREGSIPITGAWGRVCSGVRVRAERPDADGGYDAFLVGEWSTTTLTIEYPAAADVYFDWVGPYRDWIFREELEENEEGEPEATGWAFSQWPLLTPYLDLGHEDWQIDRFGSTIRQEMRIAWPPDAEPTLRIRSDDETCRSESLVICDFAGCELRESADAAGGEETPNRAPRAVGSLSDQTLAEDGSARTVSVSARFSDPDGDTLRYRASSSRTSVVRTSVSGSRVTLTPGDAGTATVTVTATDPGGLSATQGFAVTVTPSGGGEGAVTFPEGVRIPRFPAEIPSVLSNGGFSLSGGVVTITLQQGGYVEYPAHGYRYTCAASDCGIRGGLVIAGQITRTVAGEAGTMNRSERKTNPRFFDRDAQ